ncbi:SCO family protein [Aestuariivirga litoralis]|uniref:SCO family protein n=1 Tax=Aestuariivirga litoralis TaxID=2650924 RepID=A0A2W2BNX1_9HYPH|nr:SCO family protein [Aestuariivirga litoralis]PZF77497.1 SCO family protein [Aestuariivirga litoralis]
MPRRPVLIFAAVVLLIAAGLGSYAYLGRGTHAPQGSGTALVGGPFSLIDQDGRRVTERDFLGKYMLVFFGYTYCPDVCPTELQVMSAALDQLGPDASRIQPVFVSIDPARDTPEVLKAYVGNFGPRLMGLTGTPEEVAAIARAYRVYYTKAAGGSSSTDYLMDHSSIIYLMGPDGRFVRHMAYTTDAAKLAMELKETLRLSP